MSFFVQFDDEEQLEDLMEQATQAKRLNDIN